MDGWMNGRMGGWEEKCLQFPLAPHLECLARAGPAVTGPFSPQSWDSGMHGVSAVSRGLEGEKKGVWTEYQNRRSASKVNCEDGQPPRLRGAWGAILWQSCRPDTCGCWSCNHAARGDWFEMKQGWTLQGKLPDLVLPTWFGPAPRPGIFHQDSSQPRAWDSQGPFSPLSWSLN